MFTSTRRWWMTAIALLSLPVTGATAQSTWRVSVDSSGGEANGDSFTPTSSVSADGRFVAFTSRASNLVPGDTNGWEDVFVHDRQTGLTTRVNVDSIGTQSNGGAYSCSISGDARFVAFDDYGSNLVAGDTNGSSDVFVHDRQTGITTRVSVYLTGVEGNGDSYTPSISGDGRFVAFMSAASNLVPFDNNWFSDVFVHDRQTGTTTRVNVDPAGNEADSYSWWPSISADGHSVVFASNARLVAADTNGLTDIFLRDLVTGVTERISVSSTGQAGNGTSGGPVSSPCISLDGRLVGFSSRATNLVSGDANQQEDVFVRDRQAGTTTIVSVDSLGVQGNLRSYLPSMSADGRWVSFRSDSTNLVPGDTNGWGDVFVHDRQTGITTRVSVDSAGAEGNGDVAIPSISGDGRFVALSSLASNLVPGDSNGVFDVFIHGPHLTLEADPESAPPGALLTLTAWGGQAAGPVIHYAVEVNGVPFVQQVALGTFDAAGQWALSANVPPALSGHAVTFLSFGLAPSGRVEASNAETVSFQ